MRIVCWQTILMKYHTLFFSKIREDVAKFGVCCSRDWQRPNYEGNKDNIGVTESMKTFLGNNPRNKQIYIRGTSEQVLLFNDSKSLQYVYQVQTCHVI